MAVDWLLPATVVWGLDQVTARGVVASHRAVTRVNAQVAPKVNGPGGRAPNCRAKAARGVAHWLRRHLAPAGW